MDGNGRWAQSRGLMRLMGHKAGVKTVQLIVKAAREIGISALTLYAFSSENWKRPATEVSGLMSLLKSYLESELTFMQENNIRLHTIGRKENLPREIRETLSASIANTAANTGLVLNLALSYGSRDEIVGAARKMAKLCVAGKLSPEDITEASFSGHLFTAGLPDPDLIIRTGGEFRLSNFLLWQASYSEIFITETHWPDFTREDFIAAITTFQKRQRRFGRTGDQVSGNN
ncbi:MAG: isoprenyl transferase [Proteobacteria bacterium]|nr:isoprenyl transferase [Pseudomonadota bacterium]MBU4294976.1 isoprenyl transferase [Pseudomonadota bacterium]